MNKKALAKSVALVLIFGFISILTIFLLLVTQNFMNDTVNAVNDAIQDAGQEAGIDSQTLSNIDNLNTDYANIDFKVDLIFLFIWISVFILTFVAALLSPTLPQYNFFTFLLIGGLFFMFITNLLGQVMEYLLKELITDVFTPEQLYLPIFSFYTTNYMLIIPVWIGLLLLVNQIKRVAQNVPTQEDIIG